MQNIENKLEKIISENYPEYITIKKSYIDTLKKDINNRYTNEYTLIKKTINNFAKNPKLFKYITNFIPHCQKCDKYAYHNCTTSLLYGKFIKIIDFPIFFHNSSGTRLSVIILIFRLASIICFPIFIMILSAIGVKISIF